MRIQAVDGLYYQDPVFEDSKGIFITDSDNERLIVRVAKFKCANPTEKIIEAWCRKKGISAKARLFREAKGLIACRIQDCWEAVVMLKSPIPVPPGIGVRSDMTAHWGWSVEVPEYLIKNMYMGIGWEKEHLRRWLRAIDLDDLKKKLRKASSLKVAEIKKLALSNPVTLRRKVWIG